MKAVTMISGFQSKEYEDKLKELHLQSLEERWIRYDIIQVLKLMHNYDAEDRRQFFKTASIIPVYLGRKLVNLLIILPV